MGFVVYEYSGSLYRMDVATGQTWVLSARHAWSSSAYKWLEVEEA